jgi:hypothetical protein
MEIDPPLPAATVTKNGVEETQKNDAKDKERTKMSFLLN